MKNVRSFALLCASSVLPLGLGCALDADDVTAEAEVQAGYLSPGVNLGKATHLFADVVGDAAFVVFDRKLERRGADGGIEGLGTVAPGFASLTSSPTRVAYVTSSRIKGRVKTLVHVLDRSDGYREILTFDVSTPNLLLRHPLLFLEDGGLLVGSGEEVFVLRPDGSRSTFGGGSSRLRGQQVLGLHAAADPRKVHLLVDTGVLYVLDLGSGALTRVSDGFAPALFTAFDRVHRRWVRVDPLGIELFDERGARTKRVDLAGKKRRTITAATLLADGSLFVAHGSEARQDRSVLAVYELPSLTRRELGTLDGAALALSSTSKSLFSSFSPIGAAGFGARVTYAFARPL